MQEDQQQEGHLLTIKIAIVSYMPEDVAFVPAIDLRGFTGFGGAMSKKAPESFSTTLVARCIEERTSLVGTGSTLAVVGRKL